MELVGFLFHDGATETVSSGSRIRSESGFPRPARSISRPVGTRPPGAHLPADATIAATTMAKATGQECPVCPRPVLLSAMTTSCSQATMPSKPDRRPHAPPRFLQGFPKGFWVGEGPLPRSRIGADQS